MTRHSPNGRRSIRAMADSAHEDDLMQRAATGDREAMDRLYAALAGPLYNYLLRLAGDDDHANDALQATFLNAWHGRSSFRGTGARPWLFVIARNAWLRLRDQHPHLQLVDDAPAPAGPESEHTAAELADRLEDALARLPEDTREAIVLSRVSGLGLDEIAELLGTSNGALRVRLCRGLQRLKEELHHE